MYAEEMENWIAEAKREEANSEARIAAALMEEATRDLNHQANHRSQGSSSNGGSRHTDTVAVLVGGDNEEMTVVHRNVLPDLTRNTGSSFNSSSNSSNITFNWEKQRLLRNLNMGLP